MYMFHSISSPCVVVVVAMPIKYWLLLCTICCPFVQKNGMREPTGKDRNISTKNDHLKINFKPRSSIVCRLNCWDTNKSKWWPDSKCEAIRYEWTSFINHLQGIYAKAFFHVSLSFWGWIPKSSFWVRFSWSCCIYRFIVVVAECIVFRMLSELCKMGNMFIIHW